MEDVTNDVIEQWKKKK